MSDLFISDLHLHPQHPAGLQLFESFVCQHAGDAERLFILGDLFEYYLGDDALEHSGYASVAEVLAGLQGTGTEVLFMHGNRDFLVGDDFMSRIGGRLLADPTRIDLGGHSALLMHGDSLCTDDVEHQAFRARSRSTAWQQDILSRTIAEREAIARQMRMDSEAGKQVKAESIMDVNQRSVEAVMQEQEVSLLIHGHTHRPAFHHFTVAGQPAHRLVLGDWYRQGSYIVRDGSDFTLRQWPGDTLVEGLAL